MSNNTLANKVDTNDLVARLKPAIGERVWVYFKRLEREGIINGMEALELRERFPGGTFTLSTNTVNGWNVFDRFGEMAFTT